MIVTVGAVNEGKPTVTVYYDYLCHVCNDLESQVGGDLVKKAAAGEITLAYQPVSVVGDVFSKKAMQADYYVASKVPEKYVEFHKKFFSDISSSAIKNRKVPPVGDIVKLAKKVGLSSAQADELEKTLSGDAYGQLAEQANQQFQNDKLTGTPAVIVNGNRQLVNWPNGVLQKVLSDLPKESAPGATGTPAQ